MAVVDVCRLCLATDDLVWIFDEKNKKLKMQDIISIATGIQIHTKDVISQRICGKCYQFCINIFQFRGQCLKTDKFLKKMCMDYLVDKKHYIPNTEVTIKSVVEHKVVKTPKNTNTRRPHIHPSVLKICCAYPEIKLPRICLNCNMAPIVEMEMDQVENYFKKRKLDFKYCVNKAKQHSKVLTSKKLSSELTSLKEKNALKPTKAEFNSKVGKRHNFKNHRKISNKNLVKKNKKSRTWASIKIKLKKRHKKGKAKKTNLKVAHNTNIRKRKFDKSFSSTKIDESINSSDNSTNILSIKKRKLNVSEDPLQVDEEKTIIDVGLPSSSTKLKETEDSIGDSAITNSGLCHYTDEEIGSTSQRNEKPSEEAFSPQIIDNSKIDSGNCDSLKNTDGLRDQNEIGLTNWKIIVDKAEGNELLPINDSQLDDNEDSLTRVGKSVPLFVCQICNSVQYNMHELKKHQVKHMRCQFCKVRFRSLEQKSLHLEKSCAIKRMMIDVPHVAITKIDHNTLIREKYPNAFVGFPVQSESSNPNISYYKTLFSDFPPERLSVIEILSEDETSPIDDNENYTIVPHITSNIFTVLNENASDRNDFKTILTIFQKDSKELGTETVLPSNEGVVTKRNAIILKNLTPYLSLYKIPVKLQLGNLGASYDYNPKSKSPKNRSFWNDLTPIDIKSKAETDS